MFTGIIEELGKIKSVKKGGNSVALSLEASKVLSDVKLGDSIAVNGVCLTVTSFTSKSFTADVMPETMSRTNLGSLNIGAKVNMERALRVGDRLGGHMVSGHIDGQGEIVGTKRDDNAIWITIAAPKNILKYIIEKGSIAIDGISLTVAYVDEKVFKVSIIPHTQDETTLCSLASGTKVNLENDLTAKYIEKFIYHKEDEPQEEKSSISMDMLKENGFI